MMNIALHTRSKPALSPTALSSKNAVNLQQVTRNKHQMHFSGTKEVEAQTPIGSILDTYLAGVKSNDHFVRGEVAYHFTDESWVINTSKKHNPFTNLDIYPYPLEIINTIEKPLTFEKLSETLEANIPQRDREEYGAHILPTPIFTLAPTAPGFNAQGIILNTGATAKGNVKPLKQYVYPVSNKGFEIISGEEGTGKLTHLSYLLYNPAYRSGKVTLVTYENANRHIAYGDDYQDINRAEELDIALRQQALKNITGFTEKNKVES